MNSDDRQEGGAADAGGKAARGKVRELLALRGRLEERAKAWIASPDFDDVYQELHHGWLFTSLAYMLGKGGSFLRRTPQLRAAYGRLATEGELLLAILVMGNSGLSENMDLRLPAAVVATREQDEHALARLAYVADELGDAYLGVGAYEMPQCEAIVSADEYRNFGRRELPSTETGLSSSALYHIRISGNEMLEGSRYAPFVPLLASRDGAAFLSVPWRQVLG